MASSRKGRRSKTSSTPKPRDNKSRGKKTPVNASKVDNNEKLATQGQKDNDDKLATRGQKDNNEKLATWVPKDNYERIITRGAIRLYLKKKLENGPYYNSIRTVECVEGDCNNYEPNPDLKLFYLSGLGLYRKKDYDNRKILNPLFLAKPVPEFELRTLENTGENTSSASDASAEVKKNGLDVEVETVVATAEITADKEVHEEVAKPSTSTSNSQNDAVAASEPGSFVLSMKGGNKGDNWIAWGPYMEAKYPKQEPKKATKAEIQEALLKLARIQKQWNITP